MAIRLTSSNWLSASATPIRTIAAKISRRTRRRRVFATGESPSVSFVPRRTSVRSTISAIAIATTTVTIAVTTSPFT